MIASRVNRWRNFWFVTWKTNLRCVCSVAPNDTAEAWKKRPETFCATLFVKKTPPPLV
jgi:hypothetical protein